MKRDKLFEYTKKHYKSEPEYLWKHLPDYAVLRHSDSDKWFGIVMNVPGCKLGLDSDDEVDILEVKVRPEHIGSLRKKEGILPGYHMNKEHWVTVILSGQLTDKEIHELLNESHNLTF
ncbi:TPA: MmcQ/YjbR family DNA-binding protein [Pseudomonas putida]|nr:MmcQ/YjbR family DNA-binding protein [Pseudomonas putida]